jgi:putative tryptophan/tyrosine transport system substrate-binding protein
VYGDWKLAIYYDRFFSEPGGLISYGDARSEQFRLAAGYIDRVLKGEKPADPCKCRQSMS